MFLKFFSQEVVGTTLMLYILWKGLTQYQANVVIAVFSGTVLLMEIPTGIVADLFGRRISVTMGMILQGSAYSLFVFGKSFETFIMAEVLIGIGYTLQSGALEAWAVDYIKYENPDAKIDKLMSNAFIVCNIAGIFCGILGGYLADKNMLLPWMISVPMILILAVYAWCVMKEPYFERKVHKVDIGSMMDSVKNIFTESFQHGFKNKYLVGAFIVGILVAFSNAAGNTLQQSRMTGLTHHGIWILGWIKAGYSIFMMIGSKAVLRLSRKYSDGTTVVISVLMIGFWLILCGVFNTFGTVVLFFFIYEIGRGMYGPAMQIYLNNRIENDKRATILSFASGISQVGMIFGLFISGIMTVGVTDQNLDQGPIRVVWIIFGAVALIAGVISIGILVERRKGVCKDIKG